jgi:hypothetical protein
MFGSIGMPELIIIFVIALIVFGPRELRHTLEEEIRVEEQRSEPPHAAGTTAASPTHGDPVSTVARSADPHSA